MKKLFATVFLLAGFLVFGEASAQWQFVKAFPDTNLLKSGTGCHGIAVDRAGKIWVQLFSVSDSVVITRVKRPTRVIYVFNPNGTQAPFSPIRTITVAGVKDSLTTPPDVSNRGLRTDHEGNILSSHFDRMYRLNYRTGEGMNKVLPRPNASLTAPAVDQQGNIFTAQVAQNAHPIQIFAKDFSKIGVAVDTSRGFSRSFEVSRDGNTIYWAGYTNHAIYRYRRTDEFSPFAKPDTILKGFDSESFAWQPKTGLLWLSAGSYNDLPNRFPGARTLYSPNTWYGYNPQTGQIVDSLKWVFRRARNANERPRAIAFSVSGDTAYVGCFGAGDYPSVQMFVKRTTKVEEKTPITSVDGYTLSQNYPNPFNPLTEIKFSIAQTAFTTLKVYNVLGAEVATLVNDNLFAGNHSVEFDARQLPSGTYIYELRSNGVRLTKKMMLTK